MEKQVKLKTKDKHIIYGILNTPKRKTDKLIIFAHGLAGSKDERLFYNSARFFPKNGYATFRFDFYAGAIGARSLTNSSIKSHIGDLKLVIDFFKGKYKNLYLVGHSLGGLVALLSNDKMISAQVMWDPSQRDKGLMRKKGKSDDCRYDRHLRKYILRWGTEYLLSKRLVEEWSQVPDPNEIGEKISTPTKFICAGKGKLINACKGYARNTTAKTKLHIIKDAGHAFNEEGVEEELFAETLSWIKKF